jgi:hypothetical protein
MRHMSSTSRSRVWLWCLSLMGLVILVSACGDSAPPPARPAVWTPYQGQAFAMTYLNSWGVATKDLYLGTSYPELEMLQGMAFTSPDNGTTTFLQVVSAEDSSGKASVQGLLLKYILGTSTQPVAASSLTTTTLAGETWSQGTVEKTDNGSTTQVKETALGVKHKAPSGKTELYVIIYQADASTAEKIYQDFFARMMDSFQFAS